MKGIKDNNMDNYQDDFDAKIRDILNDSIEEVPVDLWSGISAGLDKIDAKKKTIIFWKRFAGYTSIAVAAALAFVLVLTHPKGGFDPNAPTQKNTDSLDDAIALVTTKDSDKVDENKFTAQENNAEVATKADKPETILAENTNKVSNSSTNVASNETKGAEKTVAMEEVKADDIINNNGRDNGVANDKVGKTQTLSLEEVSKKELMAMNSDDSNSSKGIAVYLNGLTSVSPNRQISNIKRAAALSGITPSETTLIERNNNINYSLPLSFGLGIKVDLSPRWSIGTGINYTLLSKKVNVRYTEIDENSAAVVKDITSYTKNDQHYLGIPLNVYFSIIKNNKVDFYTYAGGAVDKCIINKYSNLDGENSFTYVKKTTGFQPSVNAGLGVEFFPTSFMGIYIDPSINYFFKSKQPNSIRTRQPLSFQASIGLRFRI